MTLSNTSDRRQSRRIHVRHDVVLQTSLLLLDVKSGVSEPARQPLIIYGTTLNLSQFGVGLTIPYIKIDEKFCDGSFRLSGAIFLPEGQANVELAPVRCEATNEKTPQGGYFVGAILTASGENDELLLHNCVNAGYNQTT